MRISDWSSDVCSSDLDLEGSVKASVGNYDYLRYEGFLNIPLMGDELAVRFAGSYNERDGYGRFVRLDRPAADVRGNYYVRGQRSEEHTSELQSLMRISYAVFCLKKKIYIITYTIRSNPYTIYILHSSSEEACVDV